MSRHSLPSLYARPTSKTQFEQPHLSSTIDSEAESTPGASKREHQRRWLRNLLLLVVCGTLALTFTVSLLAAQTTDDPWIEATMITSRNSHSLTELTDGRMLAVGGWDGRVTVASAEIYDPVQQAWLPTSAMSETRGFHIAARLPDGHVLVAGGWDLFGRPLTSTEIYDPGTGVWQPGAALAEGRAGHVAAPLADGRILVAAGCGLNAEALATAEVYDAKATVWQAAGTLTEGRCWPTVTVLADGRVLLVGGRDREGRPVAGAELYDPVQNAWMPAGKLQTPRLEHTATLLPDGRVLVAGGYDGSAYLASMEVYDPATNAWIAAGDMTTARANHAALLLRDEQVLVAGGSAGSRPSLEAERYDPASGRWTSAGTLPARYEALLLTELSDGRLLVTGRPELDEAPARLVTPEPVRTPGPRGPTPTPQGAAALNAAASAMALGNVSNEAVAMAQEEASASTSNYSTGTQTARLFGVHEVSFTRPQPTSAGYNPYAETLPVTFDPPGVDASGNLTVRAFYDGASDDQETWRARVYVQRVGTWHWQPPAGTYSPATGQAFTDAEKAFQAEQAADSGLHGMLRVSSVSDTATSNRSQNGNVVEAWATRVGAPKRWYTDDGRTFLPMADTAYRLFFEKPVTSNAPVPTECPPWTTVEAPAFVATYTSEDASRGINVLRTMALGTWAYSGTPAEDCTTDLSLYWSSATDGSSSDLFDGQPSLAALQAPTVSFYPNLESFQRADRKLRQLLDERPELYVQVIFLPDSYTDNHPWRTIDQTLRTQMWANMAARWAAFPNVFWTITNDTADKVSELTPTPTPTPTDTRSTATPGPTPTSTLTPTATPTELYIITLAKEVGCYFADHRDQAACSGVVDYNPWRTNRPLSVGHLRNTRDAFAPAMSPATPSVTPSATPTALWHNYITAYTGADLSAQHLDGTIPVPWDSSSPGSKDPLLAFRYADQPEPVLNTEDLYESSYRPSVSEGTPTRVLEKQVANPAYFFRRLFWSHLLSGSGATYGADTTWQALAPYATATYTVQDNSCPAGKCKLEGLDDVQHIQTILANARIDLNLFKPQDQLVNQSGSGTAREFNRVQVAANGPKELLAYIPNAAGMTDLAWDNRRQLVAATTTAFVPGVDLRSFTDAKYSVEWYNPATGDAYPGAGTATPTPIPGARWIYNLQPPFSGDAILHISSRCTAPNVCEPMDSTPPAHNMTSTLGINLYAEEPATLTLDQTQYVIGNDQSDHGSWRCDRNVANNAEDSNPGCILTYLFPTPKTFASVDYYFRRNTRHAHQSISFITAGEDNIVPGKLGYWAEAAIDVGINPEQDIFSQLSEGSGDPYAFTEFDFLHDVPLDSNRWYHLKVTSEAREDDTTNPPQRYADLKAYIDGQWIYSKLGLKFNKGDTFFTGVQLHTAWWGPIDDLPMSELPTVWLDEVSIDPPPDSELQGLYSTYFQQGLGGYADTSGTYFDGAAGYNGSSFFRVGANNYDKALLRFDTDTIPENAVVDEATLALFHTTASNSNSLTLGAHAVLSDWAANAANRIQRQAGINWQVAGMGGGSDYAASPAASLALTQPLTDTLGVWVELDITDLAQTWVSDAGQNHGLVLLQEAASGSVLYSFCSEVAQAPATPTPPCLAEHAPKLTLRYHVVDPAPLKASLQHGSDGYTGDAATYFDGSGSGYNNSTYLRVSADGAQKSLLRFDVSSIPITDTIAIATLRVYQKNRSNSNSLTLAAHQVLADWTDSQANRVRRQTGVNWQVAGMGAGSDYAATVDGAVELTSADRGWVDLDVTDMVRAWVANSATNHGLVLLPQASGSVTYSFCSELGWNPCTAVQAPTLNVWHYTPPPTPEPEPEQPEP